jgi:copper chaperone CopZ
MVTQGEKCALCGLAVGDAPVVQEFGGRQESFCCGGCRQVYQLARDSGMLEQVLARYQSEPSAPKTADIPSSLARFAVQGMHCPNCAKTIVRTLRRQVGIVEAEVDLASRQGQMRYDPTRVDPVTALHCLDGLGYQVRLLDGS